MDKHGIYFAAVVWPKDTEQPPYVSTPLGPYHPDELAAHQRGKQWLTDVYKTEDIRRCDPNMKADVQWARTMIMNEVHKEYRKRLEAKTLSVHIAIFANADVAVGALDEVIEALGALPEDV